MRSLYLILSFIAFSLSLEAQTVIRGVVADENSGETLIGATVVEKGTTKGTITDWDGSFELKTDSPLPLTLTISYLGYASKDHVVVDNPRNVKISMSEGGVLIDVVEVEGKRISEKQKAAPLTVESLDILAIKETPADNFYDGLGALKGVDVTGASLGFKIINTRGFNSTSPVRSLQIIDGVDNQAPGLNFSLGNFLGSSELDVLKVDIIVGASSAFYGPNAFNGVISMETKNPFFPQGMAASIKVGERNMMEGAFRYSNAIRNKDSLEFLAVKINFSYLRADDWEADNYNPVFDSESGLGNPGGWDKVNSYGDEYFPANDATTTPPWNDPGLGIWHRQGYNEIDLVDYDTRNIKSGIAFHLRTKPALEFESPELILASSFGNGTTVYQGDNRFSLRNILFFQNRLEYRKKGKYFIRAYATNEDAGDSYDPYFTALRLLEAAKPDGLWSTDYRAFWKSNYDQRARDLGYPLLDFDPITFEGTFDNEAAEQWLIDYQDTLAAWHANARDYANLENLTSGQVNTDYYAVGTQRFEDEFNRITSSKSNEEEGGDSIL